MRANEEQKDMGKRLWEFAESTFKLDENEGEDKVTSLEEAIRRHVKPGMVLHVSAWPALREILRQFWGKKPKFTLIRPGGLVSCLVHCGLVEKIIGGFGGEGEVPNEIWSSAGIYQRLLAGALGTGFIPTKSMIGTTIAEDNKDFFRVIDDPFGSGRKVGIIKALNPDLTIVHGWAADYNGNTILVPNDTEWSAFASKNEVVVTVERLVSTAFIREHSPLLVRIPGYRVNSVSVVPLGAHPAYVDSWRDIKEFQGYGEDDEFVAKYQEAAKNPKLLDAWIKEWVLDCPSHEDYLRKLGFDKIQALKEKAKADAWESRLPFILKKVSQHIEYNEREMMVVAASRKIKEAILKNGYKVVLVGVGTTCLAAYLAYYQLKREGHLVALTRGDGVFDYTPRPEEPYLSSLPNCYTSKIRTNHVWTYNLLISGENQRSISILGAAQIDKFGNMNSGIIGGKIAVSPPGGSADAYQACETIAVMAQSKSRFLEKVPYITALGARVKTLVSTLGIFEKLGDDEEFSLIACLPNPKFPTLEEKIKNAKENCGWELRIVPKVEEISPPTFEEVMTLRIIDPDGVYCGQHKMKA